MTVTFLVDRSMYEILKRILSHVERLETRQMAINDDIQTLTTEVKDQTDLVTKIQTDVSAVLTKLSGASNLTPDQVTSLQAAIKGIGDSNAALAQVASTMEAAANGPTPGPDQPTPVTPPTPDQPPTPVTPA